MKCTKQINHARFRKNWCVRRMAPVALVIGSVFVLPGCEKRDENVSLYMNSDDHTRANPSLSEQRTTAYNTAQHESVKPAPKYASIADCVAELGEERCTHIPAQSGLVAESQHNGSMLMPLIMGYMMGGGGGHAQQPLFTSRPAHSPAHDHFIDTSDRSITTPKIALSPKPATTQTITRGGFGETVAKQNTLSRTRSYPTMGG